MSLPLENLESSHEPALLEFLAAFSNEERAQLTSIWRGPSPWSEFTFRQHMKIADDLRLDWRPGPGKVSVSAYVLRSPEGRVIAAGAMRFPLEGDVEASGGNLFVAVAPELRGQNIGSYCLSRLLFEAVRAGLRRVFVSCPASDLAARRMIEKNRGLRQDSEGPRAEYWIDFR